MPGSTPGRQSRAGQRPGALDAAGGERRRGAGGGVLRHADRLLRPRPLDHAVRRRRDQRPAGAVRPQPGQRVQRRRTGVGAEVPRGDVRRVPDDASGRGAGARPRLFRRRAGVRRLRRRRAAGDADRARRPQPGRASPRPPRRRACRRHAARQARGRRLRRRLAGGGGRPRDDGPAGLRDGDGDALRAQLAELCRAGGGHRLPHRRPAGGEAGERAGLHQPADRHADARSGAGGGKPGRAGAGQDDNGATLVAHATGAQCRDTYLSIGAPPAGFDRYVLPGNNYHVYDVNLFWANVRADAVRRVAAFGR